MADALVATAFGIFIAMLGLTFFNALNNQVRRVNHQLDLMKVMIMNRTDGAPIVPSSARQGAVTMMAPEMNPA